MTKWKKRRYHRDKAFVLRDDDGTIVGRRMRALGILAIVRFTGGNKRKETVNRDFNAAINTR